MSGSICFRERSVLGVKNRYSKYAILGPIALFIALLSVGQTLLSPVAAGQTAGPIRLQWNWERQEELSWHVSISRLKNLQLSERRRLIQIIAEEIRDVILEDYGVASEEHLAKIAAETRIKYMDLSGDGEPEVIAQAGAEETGCSPTGNCPF